mmetsp:Transcript_122608/g.306217  ORF Transcript_122608/g.306217 Transcript_122608/m.306217 type:complete len:102 (+) Transcript_122608:552-857(+)
MPPEDFRPQCLQTGLQCRRRRQCLGMTPHTNIPPQICSRDIEMNHVLYEVMMPVSPAMILGVMKLAWGVTSRAHCVMNLAVCVMILGVLAKSHAMPKMIHA